MGAFNIGIEIIGWTAAAIILASYILLSLGKLEPRGYLYQWMNVVGAGGFVICSGFNGALPWAGLNFIWGALGRFTLWSVWRARTAARATVH
ncbi:MAG: CBU_0592 family membrane protein [Sphingopyxis sp.]